MAKSENDKFTICSKPPEIPLNESRETLKRINENWLNSMYPTLSKRFFLLNAIKEKIKRDIKAAIDVIVSKFKSSRLLIPNCDNIILINEKIPR